MSLKEKPIFAIILSMTSGISILLFSTLLTMAPAMLGLSWSLTMPTKVLSVIASVFGVLVLAGAFLMHDRKKVKSGAFIVILFSFLSLIIGGVLFEWYFLGFILGIIGGIKGLTWKPKRKR